MRLFECNDLGVGKREREKSESRRKELSAVSRVLKFREQAARACERVNFSPDNIEQLFSLAAVTDFSLSQDVVLVSRPLSRLQSRNISKHKGGITLHDKSLVMAVVRNGQFFRTGLSMRSTQRFSPARIRKNHALTRLFRSITTPFSKTDSPSRVRCSRGAERAVSTATN